MKGSNFTYLVKQGITSIWHNGLMSFASFCILMVSLLLIGLATLLMVNTGIVMDNIEAKNEILVYVEGSINDNEQAHIYDALDNNPNTEKVVFYSKEEAWADKQEEMSEFAPLFSYLEDNPMPHTYRVTIKDLTIINNTVNEFSTIEKVVQVSAPYDYANFLVDIRTTLTLIASAVLAALIVVCVVIVYNSTRTSVFARRKEINIMKYVGATNAFIKIPFFIEGMFIGIIAGVASWGLTKLTYDAVIQIFSEDLTIWQVLGMVNIIPFDDVTWYVLAFNCAAGALLGALGTVFSMGKHLKV